MAINLYITSTQNFSGKSAVCVGFIHRLRKDGYRVGYFKPFSSDARVLAEGSVDEDARFVKELFDLSEPVETLAPVVITNRYVHQLLVDGGINYNEVVKAGVAEVSRDRDIVVMEGSDNFRGGYIANLSLDEITELLDAKVITVVGYQDNLQVVDDTLMALHRLSKRLVGVIINSVPVNRMDYVQDLVMPYFYRQGIRLLAALPYQQMLHSISIAEIVEALNGELLCGDCSDELVENLMVAAMNVEQALNYFRQVTNKAVIVGGDRPDIQLAALETSTKVLILTGYSRPNPMIEARAEERGVSIILSHHDTLTTVEKVEQVFGKTRFHQMEKVEQFEHLLDATLNFDELYRILNLQK